MTRGDEFNCPDCDVKLKEERGCEKKGIMPCFYGNEIIYKCPLKLITPVSWEYLKAFNFYLKSILPNGKGWLEESDKFLHAMQLIDGEYNKINNEKINKN